MTISKEGWKISGCIRFCLWPPESSQTYWIFPKISIALHIFSHLPNYDLYLLQIEVRKTEKINCWRNISPITTVITQSVGTTSPLANQCSHVHANHSFCKLTFRFSSGSACFCSTAFSRLFMQMSCLNSSVPLPSTTAFQTGGKMCVMLNVICLYLP